MNKSCSVFVQGDSIFVSASRRLTSGIRVGSEPIITCSLKDRLAVGNAIVLALSAFKEGDCREEEQRSFEKALFKTLRVRSWSALENLSDYVSVEETASGIEMRPSVRGDYGGYEFVDPLIRVSANDPEAIGNAVQEAVRAMRNP
jgi:hypothetical protein